jgi:3-methyl-2-oxobutanoate hydroxymethyltransferase
VPTEPAVSPADGAPRRRPVTVRTIQRQKEKGERIVMVTAYDAPTARIVDRAGPDIVLVGDSLAMVVLGYDTTLKVDMEDMLRHTAAVCRTRPTALVVADMPFLSYQVSIERAVENAGRLVRDGGADAVKLEGGQAMVPAVLAIVRASIPVMGHLGLTPQSVKRFGGYRVQGRGADASEKLIEDALALEQAGVFAMVLEGIPRDLGHRITQAVSVPTIGIGAGPETDGQVLVLHDLIGLSEGRLPRFVKRYGEIGRAMETAVASFASEVRSGSYPDQAHWYE